MPDLAVSIEDKQYLQEGAALAKRLGVPVWDRTGGEVGKEPAAELVLRYRKDGLSLCGEGLEMKADFSRMTRRVERWQHELLVKAAKGKTKTDEKNTPLLIAATAGLGEDSLLLAAAGFHVVMYERDPVIAALLRDALRRGKKIPGIRDIVPRMELLQEDSTRSMRNLSASPDVIYLDPMFPQREKSALIKKKFQLLHHLEGPEQSEEELLSAAVSAGPSRIVIKRPPKGPYLGGRKPSYSIEGKAVRFDVISLR